MIYEFLKPEIVDNILDVQDGWRFEKVTSNSKYVDLTIDREEFTGY